MYIYYMNIMLISCVMMSFTYNRRKKDALAEELKSEKADLWEAFCRWRLEAQKAGLQFALGEAFL